MPEGIYPMRGFKSWSDDDWARFCIASISMGQWRPPGLVFYAEPPAVPQTWTRLSTYDRNRKQIDQIFGDQNPMVWEPTQLEMSDIILSDASGEYRRDVFVLRPGSVSTQSLKPQLTCLKQVLESKGGVLPANAQGWDTVVDRKNGTLVTSCDPRLFTTTAAMLGHRFEAIKNQSSSVD